MKKIQNLISAKPLELPRIISETVPPLFLATLIVVLYGSVLWSFWLADDSQILKHAILYRPWEYFFSPRVWQELSAMNFTPWVSLSFYVDWKIFGLHPSGFYLHHLISLCLLACVAYADLRLWFSVRPAFFGLLLFAVSPPFAESAQFLMVRHYIEGLIFALLSLLLFVKAIRNSGLLLPVASAFFYLLSCSAKEIYVPLPFLFLFLPESDLRTRARLMLPCLAVTLFYVSWRWFMLGKLSGGYGVPLTWQDAGLFFPRIAAAMAGTSGNGRMAWWLWLIGASSLAALTTQFALSRKNFLFIIIVSLLVFMPIVPVSPMMSPRFVWGVSFSWVVLHVSAWDRLSQKANPFFVCCGVLWTLILLIGFFSASSTETRQMKDTVTQQSREGIFFFQKGTTADLLINPKSPGHYYAGLAWLRREVVHLPEGPAVLADNRFLCLEDQLKSKYRRVWYFDARKGDLVSENLESFSNKICSQDLLRTIRLDVPLSVKLEYRDAYASWAFGPYQQGSYELLSGQTAEYSLPLSAGGRAAFYMRDSTIQFRLRYSSPEGWVTYSPLLNLEVKNGRGSLQWKR